MRCEAVRSFTSRRHAAYLCTHLRIQYWLEPMMQSRWIRSEIQRRERESLRGRARFSVLNRQGLAASRERGDTVAHGKQPLGRARLQAIERGLELDA